MSAFRVCFAACCVWLVSPALFERPAAAQFEANNIVETAEPTPLKVESEVVHTTGRGERLLIEKVQEEWLWVKADNGTSAWIKASDVRLPVGPYRFPKTSIAVSEIPGLTRSEVYRYPEAGLGTSVRYESGDFRADMYVYDLNEAGIPDGHESEQAEKNFQQAIGDIRRAEEQGRYSSVEELATGAVPLGDHAQARWALFRVEVQGERRYSELYVTARDGQYVKLRISYPAAAVNAHRQRVLSVLGHLDGALRKDRKESAAADEQTDPIARNFNEAVVAANKRLNAAGYEYGKVLGAALREEAVDAGQLSKRHTDAKKAYSEVVRAMKETVVPDSDEARDYSKAHQKFLDGQKILIENDLQLILEVIENGDLDAAAKKQRIEGILDSAGKREKQTGDELTEAQNDFVARYGLKIEQPSPESD